MAAATAAAAIVLVFLPWAEVSLSGYLPVHADREGMSLPRLSWKTVALAVRLLDGGYRLGLPQLNLFMAFLGYALWAQWEAVYRTLEFANKTFSGSPEAPDSGIKASNEMIWSGVVFIAVTHVLTLPKGPDGGPGFRLPVPASIKPAFAPWALLTLGVFSRCLLAMRASGAPRAGGSAPAPPPVRTVGGGAR
jgi:hypothetical protein